MVLREFLSKQGDNNTSTASFSNYKKQPWPNLLHQITLNSPKLNGKCYLKSTSYCQERQIIGVIYSKINNKLGKKYNNVIKLKHTSPLK